VKNDYSKEEDGTYVDVLKCSATIKLIIQMEHVMTREDVVLEPLIPEDFLNVE
jgi:hypothetical protein